MSFDIATYSRVLETILLSIRAIVDSCSLLFKLLCPPCSSVAGGSMIVGARRDWDGALDASNYLRTSQFIYPFICEFNSSLFEYALSHAMLQCAP